jgi:septal ring factor EnvC (AmiA/AmiB activator)
VGITSPLIPRSKATTVFCNNFSDFRLEADVKRLKTDLQSSRQLEQDLRSQINTLISGEKSIKSELAQLQQDNDDLQSK